MIYEKIDEFTSIFKINLRNYFFWNSSFFYAFLEGDCFKKKYIYDIIYMNLCINIQGEKMKEEIKKRRHSFKVILVITVICLVLNILECVLKRQIDTINMINFVILVLAFLIGVGSLIYLKKLEDKDKK